MRGTPILHDGTQNDLNGVLVFADQFSHCKALDIKMSWVFLFEYVQFNNWHCLVDTMESKFTQLKEKIILLRNELSYHPLYI